jgi:uncharacterized protein YndB with AHSA1/START domain
MNNKPTADAQMLIRKPVSEVFQAFVDPTITTKFWFTKSTGRLVEGATVVWEWEMYNVRDEVRVDKLVRDQVIKITWGDPKSKVDFDFQKAGPDKTFVKITCYDFTQTDGELIDIIKDYTGGFTVVLDGLKAYLEHDVILNLIEDKFPKEIAEH